MAGWEPDTQKEKRPDHRSQRGFMIGITENEADSCFCLLTLVFIIVSVAALILEVI